MADSEEKAALLRALRQPIPALTAVTVSSREEARTLVDELVVELEGRPIAAIGLAADSRGAHTLLDDARSRIADWPEGEGILLLVDESPPDADESPDFWRALNLQREQWADLDAHVVFILRPDNYRLLLLAADHLASWMPLKFDLCPARAADMTLGVTFSTATAESTDPRSASLTLELLEADLDTYLSEPEQDPRVLLHRFYLPMSEAARNAGKMSTNSLLLERAREYAERALETARSLNDRAGEAFAWSVLGMALAGLPTGNRTENLLRAIACYESALRVLTEADSPRTWASIQGNLGIACAELPRGDPGENLARAIDCYENALRVFTEADFPQQWAKIQRNLGCAYVELPQGNRGDNLVRAIMHFENALRVYTEQDFPQHWAATQSNLGVAYAKLPRGDRGENLARAIACYQNALRVFTETDFPQDWARAQNNLGNAYANLPRGDRGENLARAIECYENALRVFTEADFPQDWAKTQVNLGITYVELPRGDRGENLVRAIECYKKALRVRTELDFPQDWAKTEASLGNAYLELPGGDRGENLARAIECYENALRVFTETARPGSYEVVTRNLARAREELAALRSK